VIRLVVSINQILSRCKTSIRILNKMHQSNNIL